MKEDNLEFEQQKRNEIEILPTKPIFKRIFSSSLLIVIPLILFSLFLLNLSKIFGSNVPKIFIFICKLYGRPAIVIKQIYICLIIILLDIILFELKVKRPIMDHWFPEIAKKRLGTEVIYYNKRVLFIEYCCAPFSLTHKKSYCLSQN